MNCSSAFCVEGKGKSSTSFHFSGVNDMQQRQPDGQPVHSESREAAANTVNTLHFSVGSRWREGNREHLRRSEQAQVLRQGSVLVG